MFELEFNGRPYIKADNTLPLFFIAGPCAIESRAHALEVSAALKEIFAAAGIPFIYKSSFDKANRSSGAGFRGVGMGSCSRFLRDLLEAVLPLVGGEVGGQGLAVFHGASLGQPAPCCQARPRAWFNRFSNFLSTNY